MTSILSLQLQLHAFDPKSIYHMKDYELFVQVTAVNVIMQNSLVVEQHVKMCLQI